MEIGTPLLTLVGNLVKGIPLDLPPSKVEYWNRHCEELHRGLDAFLRQIPVAPSIFGPARQIVLPERKEPFVPNQVIVVGNLDVNISYVDPEILAIRVEIPPRGPVMIDYRPLAISASFKKINDALTSSPVTLDMIYGLCLLQPEGPASLGVLLADGWANLFPRVLIGGEARPVYVVWLFGGWGFGVGSVGFALEWNEGDPVFSLNS